MSISVARALLGAAKSAAKPTHVQRLGKTTQTVPTSKTSIGSESAWHEFEPLHAIAVRKGASNTVPVSGVNTALHPQYRPPLPTRLITAPSYNKAKPFDLPESPVRVRTMWNTVDSPGIGFTDSTARNMASVTPRGIRNPHPWERPQMPTGYRPGWWNEMEPVPPLHAAIDQPYRSIGRNRFKVLPPLVEQPPYKWLDQGMMNVQPIPGYSFGPNIAAGTRPNI